MPSRASSACTEVVCRELPRGQPGLHEGVRHLDADRRPGRHGGEELGEREAASPGTARCTRTPLEKGPYYAVRIVPGSFGTFAGLATDACARVLDAADAPVLGLYAVGNDQASVMGGHDPAAGITIGPAMTFGYVAGRATSPGSPVRTWPS